MRARKLGRWLGRAAAAAALVVGLTTSAAVASADDGDAASEGATIDATLWD